MITHDEMRAYKKKLKALAERFTGDVTELEAEAFRGGLAEAAPHRFTAPARTGGQDAATEGDMDLLLLEREKALLDECTAALARVEEGTFGRCEGCRLPIPKRRLQAFPYARYCLRCAALREREAVG